MIGCTQNRCKCSVTMNSYGNQNYYKTLGHLKFIAAFQRVRLNLKTGEGLYRYCTNVQQNAQSHDTKARMHMSF